MFETVLNINSLKKKIEEFERCFKWIFRLTKLQEIQSSN